ncbi:MAG: hypothetical protein NTX02_13800 [Planctomycetia bacterium]|nr:hypothetical protein [Planctomycetia bacterium]
MPPVPAEIPSIEKRKTKVQMLRDTRLNHRTCMKKASVLKGRNASMDSSAVKTEKESDSEQYKKSSVL